MFRNYVPRIQRVSGHWFNRFFKSCVTGGCLATSGAEIGIGLAGADAFTVRAIAEIRLHVAQLASYFTKRRGQHEEGRRRQGHSCSCSIGSQGVRRRRLTASTYLRQGCKCNAWLWPWHVMALELWKQPHRCSVRMGLAAPRLYHAALYCTSRFAPYRFVSMHASTSQPLNCFNPMIETVHLSQGPSHVRTGGRLSWRGSSLRNVPSECSSCLHT